jgi:uncharacterized membrane protein
MPRLSILFGFLLTLLGLGVWLATGADHITSLIPAFFGLPLILAGLAGLNDAWRKHAMHLAAAIALLGVLGALGRPFAKLASGEGLAVGLPLMSQLAMALLCGLFLVLAVKSFVDARRRRAGSTAA